MSGHRFSFITIQKIVIMYSCLVKDLVLSTEDSHYVFMSGHRFSFISTEDSHYVFMSGIDLVYHKMMILCFHWSED